MFPAAQMGVGPHGRAAGRPAGCGGDVPSGPALAEPALGEPRGGRAVGPSSGRDAGGHARDPPRRAVAPRRAVPGCHGAAPLDARAPARPDSSARRAGAGAGADRIPGRAPPAPTGPRARRRRSRWARRLSASMILAVGIFAAALAAIASDRVHRTKVALIGAALVVLSQTIDQERAIEAIDFNTIGLLAGMMLIVRLTEPTGVYN